ncbi:RNA recognition motif-containing protein RRM [Tieghemostelium lacteum]|uniref:RNA recognition motif-containing protein RRM n=1 Tax=Tieghemostelium lacteum TaxID=361077 RepID=A0A152A6E4_TIELA|nr:RNA recognition motif-containing protein RRM [Tieghemostelium lacteum]|eukprot:KYR01806.1 RNA recognition motif-containing protein RRM [Tieghemostelium lacteum]
MKSSSIVDISSPGFSLSTVKSSFSNNSLFTVDNLNSSGNINKSGSKTTINRSPILKSSQKLDYSNLESVYDPIRSSSPSILMNNTFTKQTNNSSGSELTPQQPITSTSHNHHHQQHHHPHHHHKKTSSYEDEIEFEDDDELLSEGSSLSSLSSSPVQINSIATPIATTPTLPLNNINLNKKQQKEVEKENGSIITIDILDSLSSSAAADNSININSSKWFARISYFTWLAATFILIKEKRNVFIQFHALQSFMIGCGVLLLQFIFIWSGVASIVIWCSYIVFILFMSVKIGQTYCNQTYYKLPFIGNWAENIAVKRSLEYSLLLKFKEYQLSQLQNLLNSSRDSTQSELPQQNLPQQA